MAIKEQRWQLEVAREAEELLRTPAHSTRDGPSSRDSYSMLGELGATIDHVPRVCDQLANCHNREGGTYHESEDGGTEGSASAAITELTTTAGVLKLTLNHVRRAHSHSAAVRWYPEPKRADDE